MYKKIIGPAVTLSILLLSFLTGSAMAGLGPWGQQKGAPLEAEYVVTLDKAWTSPRPVKVILNYYDLHPPYPNGVNNALRTTAQVKYIRDELKKIDTSRFWGILGVPCEEHYRSHMQFVNGTDVEWFGEWLYGYDIYKQGNPWTETFETYKDEMFLRWVRGFYNYFHARGLKVGLTVEGSTVINNWRGQPLSNAISYFFGDRAWGFIKQNYDFIVLYAYTQQQSDFQQWTLQFLSFIDQQLQKQQKFWLLTRSYSDTIATWRPEAKNLELAEAKKRNMNVLTSIWEDKPTFEETWRIVVNYFAS